MSLAAYMGKQQPSPLPGAHGFKMVFLARMSGFSHSTFPLGHIGDVVVTRSDGISRRLCLC